MSLVIDAYIKATNVYCSYSEANCNTRFGTCAGIECYIFVSLQQNDTKSIIQV